jgi:mannose/cellobiose epimerase-like protein (N-acyl-D-glucosamine 2-epimerase family)
MCDFFARVSPDPINGGFYTNIDSQGQLMPDTHKWLMPTSRQVYSYAHTYLLTGERQYLDLAKRGVDFMLAHHQNRPRPDEIYWTQQVDAPGTPVPEETATAGADRRDLVINEQAYGLTGLIAYYRATPDAAEKARALEAIRAGHNYLTRHFSDYDGTLFDNVDAASGRAVGPWSEVAPNPAVLLDGVATPERVRTEPTKSYNSTVYPATSALLEMAELDDAPTRERALRQVKALAEAFTAHFPPNTPDVTSGQPDKSLFIRENFTRDWRTQWRGWQKQPEGSIGVVGHNFQGAWFLLRAESLLKREGLVELGDHRYLRAARQIVDNMLSCGAFDKQRGGVYDVFVRETGKPMWHTNKAFWQQEQAYCGLKALAARTGEEKYAAAARQVLSFWNDHFIDDKIGGIHQTVSQDGTPLTDPKGGPGISSYHAVEMAVESIKLLDSGAA